MFESAELGHRISKKEWAERVPVLRQALLDAQAAVLEGSRFRVILLVGGVDGAGKGETVNRLLEWMDPRHVRTWSLADPSSDEERQRPEMWRFWRALPPRGQLGVFLGNWYSRPIIERAYGRISRSQLEHRMEAVRRLEKLLADDGALLVKVWLHISRKEQKRRFKRLSADLATRWRVSDSEWDNHRRYDAFKRVSEQVLRQTSSPTAPWLVVEGTDARYRELTVGNELLGALRSQLKVDRSTSVDRRPPRLSHSTDRRDVLQALEMGKRISDKRYDKKLELLQGRLAGLSRHPRFRKRAMALVFEGADAAGKGGTIRRITGALDARIYRVVPIAAPTDEERAQPYLWRFWRNVPRLGNVTLFDRSWYGRVLVERVEGFCTPAEWQRAYSEINDFEEQMVQDGILVLKFWLHVSSDEQLRRFKERENVGFKRYKITEEDWRNRKKWNQYEAAVDEMVDRTSTDIAPWTLVPSEDKKVARIQVLEVVCSRLEKALK